MPEGTYESHPTYGMVGISRVQVGPPGANLFASSIRHGNMIVLRIKRAEKCRNLNSNWYHGKELIAEIHMSSTQFSDMITSPNMGDGVPCTIRYVGGEDQGQCPETNQRQVFHDELKNDVASVMADADALMAKAIEKLGQKGTVKAADKKELLEMVERLRMEIRSNMPFAAKCYDEAMERTETEAKAEVEAFIQNKVQSLGLQGLQQLAGGANTQMLPDHTEAIDVTANLGESGDGPEDDG